MIQFNLLPDVKLEYIKAQRTKKLVFSISIVSGAAALLLFVILFLHVNVIQKKQISNVDKDIKANTSTLEAIKDIDKILTVQNQLNTLDELHGKKPIASRLFDFLPQITPNNVNIGKIALTFEDNKISIAGTTDSLKSANVFVDTLKYTAYSTDGGKTTQPAFKENSVILESFGRDDVVATYTITAEFIPEIFDTKKVVKLVVPQNYVTTRSVTERPNIFDGNIGGSSDTSGEEQ